MNVLITSASRKVSLVKAFQRALEAEGGGRVVAADLQPASAALHVADRGVCSPRSDDPAFFPFLLALCREEQIGLVVPTRDEELGPFAERRDDFAAVGATVMVSAPEPIRLCQDKAAFVDFCEARGFGCPRRFAAEALGRDGPFPLFARTRTSKSSKGAFRVESHAELQVLRQRHGELLVQEIVCAMEYTLDVLSDLAGRVLAVVPRERLVVVGGESFVSRTVAAPPLVEAGARLVGALGLVGPSTVQCFLAGERALFIECNPRFGGAFALGLAAGLDSPRWLVKLARGEAVEPFLGRFRADYYMLRYTDDLFVDGEALRDRGTDAAVRPV